MKKSILLAVCCTASIAVFAKEPSAAWQQHKKLVFVENKGQITDQYGNQRPDIQYKLESKDMSMFIGNGQLHYQWYKASPAVNGQLNKMNVSSYRMDVTLAGANPNAKVIAEDKQDYSERHYRSMNEKQGITASSYKKITYQNVYPGIDWVFYVNNKPGQESHVEYDFVVHPGGKVSDIQLQYGGASSLNINSDGSLTASTPFGSITEQAPYSYTQADTKQVSSGFSLHGNTVGFTTGAHNGTLVIDPSLLWATYYGGTGFDLGFDVSTDKAGNVYFFGQSYFSADIATTGSYQENNAGDFDAYLAKFNSAGERIWATYFGGSGSDNGFSVACDGNSAVYISGYTNSSSGIEHNGFQPIGGNGNSDLYLAKFDTAGNIVWATYYGGPNNEQGGFCAVDGQGHVYLTGNTSSTTGIATPNASQTTNGGSDDAFLVQFDTAGQRQWATYIGSDSADYGEGVACDADGNVFIGGHTKSLTNIATAGSYQQTSGGDVDEFIAKFDHTGTKLWATYYGGPGADGNGGSNILACDAFGDVYLNGQTTSTSGIATSGSAQSTYGGGSQDAFLVKFDGNGNLKWGTYYGGADIDYGQNVVCDPQGNVFLCGSTKSTDNISTPGAFQDNLYTLFDAYLVEFDSAGNRQWGTYFGGGQDDAAYAATIDDSGRVYLLGTTSSPTNITTPGSFEPSYANGFDATFLAKFCYTVTTLPTISGNDSICANSTQTYSVPPILGATYIWTIPATWSGSSDSNSIQVNTDTTSGTITLKVVKCDDTSNLQTIQIYSRPKVPAIITASGFVLSTVNTHSSYQWYVNGQLIPNATGANYTATENGDYTVKVTNPGGCTDSSAAYTVTGVSVNSLEQLEQSIIIYPNPASNVVHIMSPAAVTVTISGMDGKVLIQQAQAKDVNISELATGIYLLRITNSKGNLVKTAKLTKTNE